MITARLRPDLVSGYQGSETTTAKTTVTEATKTISVDVKKVPHKLTIIGGVTSTFDGSEDVTVYAGGGSAFNITFTVDEEEVITSDKTVAEIKQAVLAKQIIVGTFAFTSGTNTTGIIFTPTLYTFNNGNDGIKLVAMGIDLPIGANIYILCSSNGTTDTFTLDELDIAKESEIPTKTSDLTNDSGFINKNVSDLTNYYTKNYVDTNIATKSELSGYQTLISEGNKLSADLVDDTNTNNKFVSSNDKSNWNSKASINDSTTSDTEVWSSNKVNSYIPEQASSSNQLADKAFVNSTVQTASANFRGSWTTWATVPTDASQYPQDYTGSKTPTYNDYMVVQDASDYPSATLTGTWRFKYTGTWATSGKNGWIQEYQVNETPMTAAQIAAINSGITSAKVSTYDGYASTIASKSTVSASTTSVSGASTAKSINVDGTNYNLAEIPNNMVTTDTTQTISGKKTFSNGIVISGTFEPSGQRNLGESGKSFYKVYMQQLCNNSGDTCIQFDSFGSYFPKNLYCTDNGVDIGLTNRRFKNLYLAGNLSDATNSISIADIVAKSVVSGTNDDTNWLTLTIDGTTKNIPQAPTNYVTTDTTQTITGQKTILNPYGLAFKFYNSSFYRTWRLHCDNNDNFVFTAGTDDYRTYIGYSNIKFKQKLLPYGNNSIDLGESSNKWKDLYLSGNLSDGTNSITVTQIVNKSTVTTSTSSVTGATTIMALNINGTDYNLGGTASGAVRYDEAQTLTDTQKTQAQTNIGCMITILEEGDL